MEALLNGTTELLRNLLLKPESMASFPIDYHPYLQFLPIALIAFVSSFLLTPLIGKLAMRLNMFDEPAHKRKNGLNRHDDPTRHIHKESVPYLGGLAFAIPLIIGMLLFLQLDELTVPFLIAIIVLLVNGFLDDKYNLPPNIQFAFHLLATAIIVVSTLDLPFVNNPLGGVINLNWFQSEFSLLNIPMRIIFPGDFLIIPWILLCINAVKWMAGSDGLLEGNMIVAYSLMFILGIRASIAPMVIMSVLLMGGLLGTFLFRFPPAKITTGSTGKTISGFIIAVLAIVKGAKVAATIIIIALPLIDALFVLVKRYIKYKPKSVFELMRINDTSHIHHQFIKMGFGPKRILLIEGSIMLLLGSIAILTTGAFKLAALVSALLLITSAILVINFRAEKTKEKKKEEVAKESPESKYSY